MSTQITKEILCPGCGAPIATAMWPGISADEEPSLRERALNETLFDWFCPECGYSARFLYPCLYSDRAHGFMLYLLPEGSPEGPVELGHELASLADVKKRIVTTGLELREKILIFEKNLDDRAVELVKYAIADVLHSQTGAKVLEGYFRMADYEQNRIGFSYLLENTEKLLHRTTSLEVYEKSLEAARSFAPADSSGFFRMSSREAEKVMAAYTSASQAAETAEA